MSADIEILLVTAASIGFIHTLTGPDHYLPFIVMGKARQWTTIKTLWITFLCGLGHVGSSIVIGAIGIALGLVLQGSRRLEDSGATWLPGRLSFLVSAIFSGDYGRYTKENHISIFICIWIPQNMCICMSTGIIEW